MLRHWVNFGLLFSFLTLMVSGLLVYLLPFSLVTTRVHIVFGLLTVVLVVMHLLSRTRYFASQTKGPSASRRMLVTILLVGSGLLVLSIRGLWPAKPLVDASYESRHKHEIVRVSSLAGLVEIDKANRLAARLPGGEANTAVSMLVRFGSKDAPPPAMAIWAETSTGSMIETLYLDSRLSYGEEVEWQGVKARRNQLLPIWRHRHTLVSGVDPMGKVDAFTTATPSHAFSLDQYLNRDKEDGFVLCVEVNAIGDANEAYPDPQFGQPSLVYSAYIDTKDIPGYRLLELTAHGGGAETSGAMQYEFEGISSAKQLLDLVLVHVTPFSSEGK